MTDNIDFLTVYCMHIVTINFVDIHSIHVFCFDSFLIAVTFLLFQIVHVLQADVLWSMGHTGTRKSAHTVLMPKTKFACIIRFHSGFLPVCFQLGFNLLILLVRKVLNKFISFHFVSGFKKLLVIFS